jgi:hypothetical protein
MSSNGFNFKSAFARFVKSLKDLAKKLPSSVPLATKQSRTVEIFSKNPIPDDPAGQWETFVKRMDNIIGEDTRDASTGRLPHVQRGRYGLDMVLAYLDDCIAKDNLLWEAANPRGLRLLNELKAISCVLLL